MKKYTIKLKKYSDVIEELVANAAIIPGMLVELMSTGKVRAHAGANQDAFPMFALEDELQGKGIDDSYAANDPVQVWVPGRGDIVNCLLTDEEHVIVGDWVVSSGDGRVRKHVRTYESFESVDNQPAMSVYTRAIIGQVVEAVDLSAYPEGSESSAGGEYYHPRVQVRIL